MNALLAIRLAWGIFALPLAVISVIAILATWPAVFGNTPISLALIAYIIALPATPAFVSTKDCRLVFALGVVTIAAQVVVFGNLNFWF